MSHRESALQEAIDALSKYSRDHSGPPDDAEVEEDFQLSFGSVQPWQSDGLHVAIYILRQMQKGKTF